MRTLSEILDVVKDGEDVPYDDLYYALVTVENLRIMDSYDLMYCTIGKFKDDNRGKRRIVQEALERAAKARDSGPKKWLGNMDPGKSTGKFYSKLGKLWAQRVIKTIKRGSD